MTEAPSRRSDHRARIVEAAAALLHEQGPAALTTRGVAERAGVQAPAIYRLFGDKDGLLEAVAEHVMARHATAKAAHVQEVSADGVDPLDDLRAGWQAQITFGLANPAVFRLLSDPERVRRSPAARIGRQVLEARVHRVALTGRLRVGEQRAADIVQAAGIGTIQSLLATPAGQRDPGLADSMFDAVLRQIVTGAPAPAGHGPLAATVAFRAVAGQLDVLSEGERHLLLEWLDRAVDGMTAES